MRDRFEAAYHWVVRSIVLSNAAFVPLDTTPSEPRPDTALVLGHLSNLTCEKGLYIYLDLLRAAIQAGLDVRGILAGPAALSEDNAAIFAAVEEFAGRLEYRGSVYGEAKARFYRDIDVFVFPTNYINEAQPTVIFEAQAAGCRVVSFDRGCIAAQLSGSDLLVVNNNYYISETLSWINQKPLDPYPVSRGAIRLVFKQLNSQALETVEVICRF